MKTTTSRLWPVLLLPTAVACYQPEPAADSGLPLKNDTGDLSEDDDATDTPAGVADCVAAHPVDGVDDFASDAPLVGDLDTVLQDILEDCDAAAVDCAGRSYVSHDAAVCVGELLGVGPGVDGQAYAAMRFEGSVSTVVWAVENHLGSRDETGVAAYGRGIWLDAETGEAVSDLYEWRLAE